MKHISPNTFNTGHLGRSFRAIKIPNEISQIESDPEVIPYPPWVIYENQFFTGLLSIN